MIAKLAFLTSPQAGVYILNYQEEGKDDLTRVEISKAHLANILVTGTALAFYEQYPHRVPSLKQQSEDNGRTKHGA
ncbi:hypothetical protein [Bradyrhizobium sp.]|uniref:hypothetical protein n=1 Tax=Bradyrhizobium sp. TaxID=376 RepID=UPI0025BE37E6|nr:hypothetical protein [Bradyrhizobium sp.]